MGIYDLLVIGASLGGLRALMELLALLPADFPLPIAIAQHRHSDSDDRLAGFLRRYSKLMVREAEDKQPIVAGSIYLAPADYHLLIEQGSLALSTEAPVLSARPSIDVLFQTAADAYASRVVGLILTGASDDGARGLARIHERGGLALVQDPLTAESAVMPLAAIAAVPASQVLPLDEIAPFLIRVCYSQGRIKETIDD
jgi:two-component system chemotaxis response regulator CheB